MQRSRAAAKPRQLKAQAAPPAELRFSVSVLNPKTQTRVTTHVIAFRSLLWEAAKGTPAASGEPDAYDIVLPWYTCQTHKRHSEPTCATDHSLTWARAGAAVF